MSKTVTIEELARNLPGYITEVADRGEHVFLKRGKRVVAELRPVGRERTLAELPAIFESLPKLPPEEVDALEKDINEARAQLDKLGVRDPWES
jgi:antitoxin (DNA-binding transcriptional repressor) of toxin-antitoxin stability system